MIEDWELGVLYLKERRRKGSEQLAAQSVKDKFLSLFAKDRDPLLFMGTTSHGIPGWSLASSTRRRPRVTPARVD
jgi:hypothetical protein